MTRPMPGPHGLPDGWTALDRGPIYNQVGQLVPPKHLTDAEIAAEYWSAMHEHADAVGRSWFYEDPAIVNAERIKAAGAGDRARAWHRFATHPHALEGERA